MADSIESLVGSLLKTAEEMSPMRRSIVTIVIIMTAVVFKTESDSTYIEPQFEAEKLAYAGGSDNSNYDKLCRLSGQIYPVKEFSDLQLVMPMISSRKDSHPATSSRYLNGDLGASRDQKLSFLPQSLDGSYSISDLLNSRLNDKNAQKRDLDLGQNNLIMYSGEVLAVCVLFGVIVYQVVLHACLSFMNVCVFEAQARAVRAMFGIRMSPDPKSPGEFVYSDMLNPTRSLPNKFLCILRVMEQDATMSQRLLFASRKASQPQSHIVIIFSFILLLNVSAELFSCITK
ncbi:MAG: hypothetical protein MHMPM18_002086 [Marteilia pararefringens]